jgi:hypothetical protein
MTRLSAAIVALRLLARPATVPACVEVVRCVLLIIVVLSPLGASATQCITIPWTARNFLTAKTDAARAIAQSPATLRVVSTLFGERVQDGDVVRFVPTTCHQVVAGVEYFIATRCAVDSGCEWSWTEVENKTGFEQFARNRHDVTRSELMEKLRAWQKRKVSTEALQRWLSTADATDSEGDLSGSLALAVVERIEDLLEFAVQAEACNPSDATWLREHGSSILLERFARLPKQETSSAYAAWLDEQDEAWHDEHEDADAEWDPRPLQSDLERALEDARSWDHSIDCFLRSQRETPR